MAYPARQVRTTVDGQLPPKDALKLLKEGNQRFVKGDVLGSNTNDHFRRLLVEQGQAPHTAIIGCADSRAPLETVFDALPGDIFVLRNAGNTCTHAEGSMVGSLEFATGALKSRLILVLGHTQCGAIKGATATYFAAQQAEPAAATSALQGLLHDLSAVAQQASTEMGPSADEEMVANHAVKVNVFHTIDFLLKYSEAIREKVRSGEVEIQGAVYHLETGKVDFMGQSPRQADLLNSKVGLPPSMSQVSSAPQRGVHGVRTGADDIVPGLEALKMLKEGNERFAVGSPTHKIASASMRQALVSAGQQPHSAILGCADSRVPVDTVFDALPGDLFVLRNAGNTCTHAEGSMVGSLEFCVSKLKTRLILVMGHTQCGAIAGACKTYLQPPAAAGSALEGLLMDLTKVAAKASDDLGPGVELDALANHAVKVNVFHSMDFLLKYSQGLRSMVESGELEIQGGIYHLATGRVEFLGRSPMQAEVLASKTTLPPSMASLPIRTTGSGVVRPEEAMKLLKEGNRRFTTGSAVAGKITPSMRKALVKDGQAPHTAIVGCADSRAPLETVFDAMPGDIFVLRNAGNTCTHAEGSILGSLEFCTAALNTKMILVLGHTACGAIKGATKTYLASKSGQKPTVSKALDALLDGLSTVAESAEKELGPKATEAQIADLAVEKNVFHSIDFLLKYSAVIREKVASGDVDIQGGVYDLETGEVKFLGYSPNHKQLLSSGATLPPSIQS